MRYPREKIQEAILHPDIKIRERAVSYFALAYSPDPSLMPMVIQAIEKYGRTDEATRLIEIAQRLRQTPETISWVIDELNSEQTDNSLQYADSLSMMLAQADAVLLRPRQSDIWKARNFPEEGQPELANRLEMLDWDLAECWKELEVFCDDAQDEHSFLDIDLDYARVVVEALARFGQECEPKVLQWLSVVPDDPQFPLMRWLEPLVVSLAGQVRLESTVPILVGKLRENTDDLLNDECVEALVRIGTPAVLHAIAEAYPRSEPEWRMYPIHCLRNIRSELAVEIIRELYGQEADEFIRMELAEALLRQFELDGIDVARQLIVEGEMDFLARGLRHELLETCRLSGVRFPEYEDWVAAEELEAAEFEREMKALEADATRMARDAAETLARKPMAHLPPPQPPWESGEPAEPSWPAPRQKIGRNDRCPCGSGKQFKACCLRK